jgi:hypothetical protein
MTQVPFVVEDVAPAIEGSTLTFDVEWVDGSTLSSPTAKVYMNNTEITSTAMPSGSHSVSGNVQTLKPLVFTAGHGGNYYVVDFQCVVDGNTEIGRFKIKVLRAGEE